MNRLRSTVRRPVTLRHWLLVWLLACLPFSAMALSFDEHTRQLPLGPSLAVFEDLRGTAYGFFQNGQVALHGFFHIVHTNNVGSFCNCNGI